MIQRFRQFVAENQLLKPDQTVLLGFSGGADSLCLLHLLRLCNYKVVCAHLNHGQRSEADEEERTCQSIAVQCGAEFRSQKVDVPALAARLRCGIEEAGRIARYRFFKQAIDSNQADVIATGHTLDDSVATTFFHLARGSGLGGLLGIPLKRGNVVRPLLFARRKETEAYCRQNGLKFIEESGNFNEQFSRVRNRTHLIPAFESLHESAVENLRRSQEILRAENELLDEQAKNLFTQALLREHSLFPFIRSDSIRFSCDLLRSASNALVRRVLHAAARALDSKLDWDQTDRLIAAIRASTKCAITTETGMLAVEADAVQITFRRNQNLLDWCFLLEAPGELSHPEFGWQIVASFTLEDPPTDPRALSAVVDFDSLLGHCLVRSCRTDDEIKPFGAASRRKLKDLLSNAKLPRDVKRRLPIVCDSNGPCWVPGVALDQRMAVSRVTRKRLKLVFGPIQSP